MKAELYILKKGGGGRRRRRRRRRNTTYYYRAEKFPTLKCLRLGPLDLLVKVG
jgi:hypothetical protein